MSVINTNVSSLLTQSALTTNNRSMNTAMAQLSTGLRINSAKDDAAGLAIAQNMTAQIRGLDQAVRNANDAIGLLQTADGAMIEQTNMIQRMRELAIQAMNDTVSTTQKGYLNQEFEALKAEVDRIGQQTQWNGEDILTGVTKKFQVGANQNQSLSIQIANLGGVGPGGSIATAAGASTALGAASTALNTIVGERAKIGAVINRLTFAADNLTNVSLNASASRSQIQDTDYAKATTELSRTQIIQQAATAMLAQANQQPSTVLALLQ